MSMIIIMIVLGAALYRARGAGLWPSRPWWHIALALPYAAAALGSGEVAAAAVVLALTTGAFLTGHASYIDLGGVKTGAANSPADGKTDEWYGGWIPWHGTYAHDFIGLMVSGLLVTAPAGVALAVSGNLSHGALIALSGALKAPCYAIGRISPVDDKLWVGEPLAGAALWGSLAAITLF